MRAAALSVSALMLTACGDAGDAERVSLPLAAPEGAHRLVADFIEICSLALTNPSEGVQLATTRGWSSEMASDFDVMMKLTGVAMLTDDSSEAYLQIIPAVYPHLDTKMCMLILPNFDDSVEDFELDIIHQTAGLQGGFMPMPGGDEKGVGRWSFIATNGQTVLVNAMKPTDSFTQMNMSTHKHLNPK